MAHDVFISYSTADKLAADAVCAKVEERSIRCWIAPRDIMPGMDWSDAIIDALNSCRVFVLLLSVASNDSEQVKRELQVAVGKGIPILPVRMEEFPLSKHMQYFIGTPHWLDAMTPPLEKHLQKLADTLTALLEATKKDNPPSVTPAPTDANSVAPPIAAAPVAPAPHWDAKVLSAVETQLCALIGPLGKLLVRKAAAAATNIEELHERLAPHLADDVERKMFQERCRAALQTSSANADADTATWTEQNLKTVERELAQYIGPLARVLVKRRAATTNNLRELYQALAENIPDTAERHRFLQAAPK